VFGVEQHPVETGIGQHFGRNCAAQTRPDTDLRLAGLDGLLELIDGQIHGLAPYA
jgi:hypothetical protein